MRQFQDKYDRMKNSYDPVSLKLNKNLQILKSSLLNQMITNIVLKQEAKKFNIFVTDDELSEQVDKIKKDRKKY